MKEPTLPKQRGRKPTKTLQEYKYENKRLKMEVQLLRDFLLSVQTGAVHDPEAFNIYLDCNYRKNVL